MKKILITSSLLIAPVVFFTACGSKEKSTSATSEEQIPIVKIATVHSEMVDQNAVYTATVEPELLNNISSSAPARIKQILVDEGVRVSAGQKVVLLDDVNTFQYETQVENARANLKNVEVNYNRALELYNIGGGTRQQVDQMELQLTNARNQLAAAERTLRNMKENTVLTSPISGIVTARNYDPGDMPANLPILTIAKVNPLKIVINATESDLPAIRTGMPATVTFDTYGNEEFHGTISKVMPTVDPQSRTFGVEITLPNSDGRILPGMFGRVHLNLGRENRVVVPDKAVVKQQGSGNHFVYIYNSDGTVTYSKVELGQRLGSTYELISGVPDGASVVTTGQTRLSNGAKVQPEK